MTDIVSKTKRSRMMSNIRQKDTVPERVVRSFLHSEGFRFRIHVRGLPGSPDLVLRKYNAAVFVHGCFWHRHEGCRLAYNPKSRIDFWNEKFRRNVVRDEAAQTELLQSGWRVATVWECGLKSNDRRSQSLVLLANWIRSEMTSIEIPAYQATNS
ncbi:MAG: DNA mismatch endonuclease Vsr [Cyanobacteria bacterium J06555_12]